MECGVYCSNTFRIADQVSAMITISTCLLGVEQLQMLVLQCNNVRSMKKTVYILINVPSVIKVI